MKLTHILAVAVLVQSALIGYLYHKQTEWLKSPYFNLVIPDSGKHVRVELNRMIHSPAHPKGMIPQFMYPEDNGTDFKLMNKHLKELIKQWPLHEKPQSLTAVLDWSKLNDDQVSQKE